MNKVIAEKLKNTFLIEATKTVYVLVVFFYI